MPSFDIVNRIEFQEVDNAVNNTLKEIATRYDFRNIKTEIALSKKEKKIHIVAADEMKMEAVREMMVGHFVRRKVDPQCLVFKDILPTSQAHVKRDVEIKEGIEQEIAKKIVKMIKDSKIKVQASIIGDEVRVTGKKIDDLQAVIAMIRQAELGLPLQFVNMKS